MSFVNFSKDTLGVFYSHFFGVEENNDKKSEDRASKVSFWEEEEFILLSPTIRNGRNINPTQMQENASANSPAENAITTIVPSSSEVDVKQAVPDEKRRVISLKVGSLEIFQLLGEGSFGKVYRGGLRADGHEGVYEVAVKVNKIEDETKDTIESAKSLIDEANFLRELNSNDYDDTISIIRYVYSEKLREEKVVFLQQLCKFSLHHFITKYNKHGLSLDKVKIIAKQIFSAISYYSSYPFNLVHADLKPANILIESESSLKIRIADFGSAVKGLQTNTKADYVVTRYYRPPEILFEKPYDYKLDIWSAGCIMFELHSGIPLFPARNQSDLLKLQFQLLGPISIDLVSKLDIDRFSLVPENASGRLLNLSNLYVDGYEHRRKYFIKYAQLRESGVHVPVEGDTIHTEENYASYRDFIVNCLQWNPLARMNNEQTLAHSFLE